MPVCTVLKLLYDKLYDCVYQISSFNGHNTQLDKSKTLNCSCKKNNLAVPYWKFLKCAARVSRTGGGQRQDTCQTGYLAKPGSLSRQKVGIFLHVLQGSYISANHLTNICIFSTTYPVKPFCFREIYSWFPC